MLSPEEALLSVTSDTGRGIYASSDQLFKHAIFGRDSLEVAEDVMRVRPELSGHIILTIAGLQGEHTNPINEEEPGRIIHEYRTKLVDGKPIGETQAVILEELCRRWGGLLWLC
jgi:glycogen debranching enzyme